MVGYVTSGAVMSAAGSRSWHTIVNRRRSAVFVREQNPRHPAD
jgi:hypothetical protein